MAGYADKKPNCVRKTFKISSIAPDELRKICNFLNSIRLLGGDWRSLASEFGYSVGDIKTLEITKDPNGPAGELIQQWDSGGDHFADEIVKIFKKIGRDDVADELEAAIKNKCQGCNCENCRSTR